MDRKIERYISEHISQENEILKQLDRATNLNVIQPRMISGHMQGEFLKILVKMVNPKRVLELGTFTGYSAISMALGLSNEAILHTIEIDDELESIATEYINKAGLREKIKQHFGNAIDIIPEINEVFDFVFIDADKREYPRYYDLLMSPRYLRPGSIILVDNVLWYGKVVEQPIPTDKYTTGVVDFNDMVANDPRVEKVILPIRDGLTLIRVLDI